MYKKTMSALSPVGGSQLEPADTVAHQATVGRFIGRLLATFVRPKPVALVVAQGTAEPVMLYEQHCATEEEAIAFANSLVGYRAVVQQDIYDFSWSVEVYPADESKNPD